MAQFPYFGFRKSKFLKKISGVVKKNPTSLKMIIFARNSNSIYPIPYPRSSLNFRGIASTKKKLGFFLRRFFGLKKRHFPIHLLYKLRVCINRDFSSVYWLLSEKLTIILLKAHVSRTNFLSGIHFWSQNCCIYYRSQAIKQYVAQGGKVPTSVKCNPRLEPCLIQAISSKLFKRTSQNAYQR